MSCQIFANISSISNFQKYYSKIFHRTFRESFMDSFGIMMIIRCFFTQIFRVFCLCVWIHLAAKIYVFLRQIMGNEVSKEFFFIFMSILGALKVRILVKMIFWCRSNRFMPKLILMFLLEIVPFYSGKSIGFLEYFSKVCSNFSFT